MLEVGWSEMLVIAIVMIVVVGPKDLPGMLRTFGRTTAKMRKMAGDFQRQFNEALKEAELDEVKKSVDTLRSLNPATEIKKQLNPFEKAAADVRAGLESLKPQPPLTPPSPAAHPAEPLKNGASALPEAATAPAPATPAASPPAQTAAAADAAKPRAPRAATTKQTAKKVAAKPAAKKATTAGAKS